MNQHVGDLGVEPLDQNAVDDYIDASRDEKAHIPDPYDPDFDTRKLFIWDEDDDNRELLLKRKGNSAVARRTMDACEDHLGLNREELLRLRYNRFELMRTFKDALLRIEDEFGAADVLAIDIRNRLEAMVANDAEYADMARFYIDEIWQLNIPIPA